MGGGGGSSDQIAREQQEQERQRLAAIQAGIGATNAVFDSPERQRQYDDYLAAQRESYFGELSRQQQEAQRGNKFALARSGLIGSRQQIDTGRDLGEAYNRGVVDADRLAQRAQSDLRAADEDSRRSIIQLVQSGADATTASSAAMRQMQTNLSGARADMNASALGQVFGTFSDLYKRSQDRAEQRRADRDLGTLYGTAAQWGYSPQATNAPISVGWGK